MDSPQQLLKSTESYRFTGARLLYIWAAMALIAGAAHTLKQPYLAMGLIPLALVFQRLNAYRFLVLVFTGYLIFFPPDWPGSFAVFLFAPDVLAIVFVLLVALSNPTLRLRLPVDSVFVPLYVFSAYSVAMVIPSLLKGLTFDYWSYDLKWALYLLLAPMLWCLDGARREPKKAFLLLLTLAALSSVHSIVVTAEFAILQERIMSWNEIFVSDAILVCALLLPLPFSKPVKAGLAFGLLANTLGLLAIQTRGLWLSTVIALLAYLVVAVFTTRRIRAGAIVRGVFLIAILALLVNYGMAIFAGKSLLDVLAMRFTHFSLYELIDPYSSTGYRLHESWAIWDQRTYFGHGTGATLRLFFTQMGKSGYLDWWSIHSGYFEFLHKLGFVGVGLFAWFYGAMLFRARALMKRPDRFTNVFGGVFFAILINHAVVSITAGYFMRWAVVIWVPMIFASGKMLRPEPANPSTANR